MQRYDCVYNQDIEDSMMEEDDLGDYVCHRDHLAALAACDAQWERAIIDELEELFTPSNTFKVLEGIRERVQREEQE